MGFDRKNHEGSAHGPIILFALGIKKPSQPGKNERCNLPDDKDKDCWHKGERYNPGKPGGLAGVAVNSPKLLSRDQCQAHMEQKPKKLPRRKAQQAEWRNKQQGPRRIPHHKRLNAAPSSRALQDEQLVRCVGVAVLDKKSSRRPIFNEVSG